jgi:hypothetical protein
MVIQGKRQRYSVVAFFAVMAMLLSFLMSGVFVSAAVTTTATFSNAVNTKFTTLYGDKEYKTSGGGSFKGRELLFKSTDVSTKDTYMVVESNYSQLTSKMQTEFLYDLNDAAEQVISESPTSYSDESLTNWYSVLQKQDGVGSKMLNMILKNTNPDFVTANKIYQPFSGLVGTLLGLGAVLIMAFLALVMICDIAYISLPPVRLFAGDEQNGKVSSKLFSHDAIYAVQCAENDDKGDGSPKQALGIYFKRRVFMLILLGICLLYLIQGQIFSLVGMVLDLVSGFFG